jgi:pimeloyl-ACP methyl ester carboxylesterase
MRPIRPLAAVIGVLLAVAVAPSSGSARSFHLGALTLHRCPAGQPGWCGSIHRPLEPQRHAGPMIPIGFEWLPASSRGRALGTVVAVEGGPGFPSTGSIVEYRGIFASLLRHRNLLLVDNRGTGKSALIRCHALDSYRPRGRASGPRFARIVGGCGRALNRRYRTRGGARVHASDLFGTAYAVQDLRAVLRTLRLRRVDLYGDSYGSWFAQAFAARFAGVLRSVILDSTYPVRALDPYYASSASSGRTAIDRVCRRDPGCTAAAGAGSATLRLGELLARVRHAPLRGTVLDVGGKRTRAVVDARRLADLFQDSGSDPLVLRDLDATVRAALGGDPAPLLRLVVQSAGNGGSADPGYFSDGAYMAVSCTDYPQLFSLQASPAVRRSQLEGHLRAAPAGAFTPFTTSEWVSTSGYSQPYDVCLDWPRPRHLAPVLPAPSRPLPASVPLLVLGGDLDDLTPLSDAERFGPTLGRRVRVVDLVNTVHVTSEGDTYLVDGARCARSIIRRFVRAPARIAQLDTRCATTIPHVHTPGAYPRKLAGAPPAVLVSGPDPGPRALRAATVAARAFADATMRQVATGATRGAGLRGGLFTVSGSTSRHFRLHAIRFVTDARVDGTGTYRVSDGGVRATLTVTAGRRRISVRVGWAQASLYARARIGSAVLSLPAP